MAKETTDRTTIDLFAAETRRGRLKRIELKVSQDLYDALNQQALNSNISRSQLIEFILQQQLDN
jgi:hypothetical protein